MQSPIVLPDPCLSEKLVPRDFEAAMRAILPPRVAGDAGAMRGRGGWDGPRPAVFDPATAPWRRNRGSHRQE
jgi:hypothetical protein